jgi:hypothetical protein
MAGSKVRYGVLASDIHNESVSVSPDMLQSEHGGAQGDGHGNSGGGDGSTGSGEVNPMHISTGVPANAATGTVNPTTVSDNKDTTKSGSDTNSKDNGTSGSSGFHVRLLFKEKVFDIMSPTLSELSTVGELKRDVEKQCDVPSNRQRLIFSGRLLSPDDKQLQFFKVKSGSSVHMFPIPAPPINSFEIASETATESSGTSSNTIPVLDFSFGMNPLSVRRTRTAAMIPVYFDPAVNQTSREVRLWCFILVFLSAMTLINYAAIFMDPTGFSNTTVFDRFVMTLEIVSSSIAVSSVGVIIHSFCFQGCSMGGMYVGSLGLESTRNFEVEQLQLYVKQLCRLAIACAVLRILWLINLSIDIQRDVNKNNKEALENPDNDINDPDKPPLHVIDQKVVNTLEIQVRIWASVND